MWHCENPLSKPRLRFNVIMKYYFVIQVCTVFEERRWGRKMGGDKISSSSYKTWVLHFSSFLEKNLIKIFCSTNEDSAWNTWIICAWPFDRSNNRLSLTEIGFLENFWNPNYLSPKRCKYKEVPVSCVEFHVPVPGLSTVLATGCRVSFLELQIIIEITYSLED